MTDEKRPHITVDDVDPESECPTVDELCKRHAKFRAFSSEIDGCLVMFEKSKEWSDYVGALTKLIKVFQKNEFADPAKVGNLAVIPDKVLLARRLAQCTNPILPGGVHRKALEAYNLILARIGPKQLFKDLPLWTAGLFALFPHANTDCKALQLKIIHDHFLPLGQRLAPCLTGLLLSLLPGIEDEASSYHDPTRALLLRIDASAPPRASLHSLWWILTTSPSARLPALRLLDALLAAGPAARAAAAPRGGAAAVLAALRAALEDPGVLVQRAALDLLLAHFPLRSPALPPPAWAALVRAALRLYARRDMSLTRRLHAWLTIHEPAGGGGGGSGSGATDAVRAALRSRGPGKGRGG
jgi:hypothetical protein